MERRILVLPGIVQQAGRFFEGLATVLWFFSKTGGFESLKQDDISSACNKSGSILALESEFSSSDLTWLIFRMYPTASTERDKKGILKYNGKIYFGTFNFVSCPVYDFHYQLLIIFSSILIISIFNCLDYLY